MKDPSTLKPLHSEKSLVTLKLEMFRKLKTDALLESLEPGKPGSLKARPDGTILDGHHRIAVLRDQNIDVDSLPREIILKEEDGD